MALKVRKIGPYEVSAVGLGCMPLSDMPPSTPSMLDRREEAVELIHAALDFGITLLDTADIYAPSWNSMGHNERLVGEAVRTWSGNEEQKAKLVLATKGGITREDDGSWFGKGGRDASKSYLYRAVEASALRLGVEKIQLWQHHRLDTSVSFKTQFENVMTLLDHGIVQNIGLSNVNAEQLKLAIEIGGRPSEGGVVSVQNEYNPRYRNGADVIDICNEDGIAFLPWSPLGGVRETTKELGTNLFGSFGEVASAKGASPFALTIAWHLANFPTSIPIPSSTKKENILETLSGINIELSSEELETLNENLPKNSPLHEELVDQPELK
ncbi:MAG: aldo/keto reductase [Actinomycetes bacterium]